MTQCGGLFGERGSLSRTRFSWNVPGGAHELWRAYVRLEQAQPGGIGGEDVVVREEVDLRVTATGRRMRCSFRSGRPPEQ